MSQQNQPLMDIECCVAVGWKAPPPNAWFLSRLQRDQAAYWMGVRFSSDPKRPNVLTLVLKRSVDCSSCKILLQELL